MAQFWLPMMVVTYLFGNHCPTLFPFLDEASVLTPPLQNAEHAMLAQLLGTGKLVGIVLFE